MNRDVFDNLIRVAESVPAEALDMASWQSECGTTCCLIGHACQDSWFQTKGLSLWRPTGDPDEEALPRLRVGASLYLCHWSAVAELMGVTESDAISLLGNHGLSHEEARADVIQRLKNYMATH